jgi:hypothetical protein
MTTKLINQRTGEFRVFSRDEAIAGTLFVGPFYLFIKGVWTWALMTWVLYTILFLFAWALGPMPVAVGGFFFLLILAAWIAWACNAPTMIRSFYEQRGFVEEAPFSPASTRRSNELTGLDRLIERRYRVGDLTGSSNDAAW